MADGAVQPNAESNLKPTEDGQGMDFAADSVLEFPDASSFLKPEAGTIALDIQPHWDGTDLGDSSFVQIKTPEMWQGDLSLLRNRGYLVFRWTDENGHDNNIGVDISMWAAEDHHAVTATWGDDVMSLYVDGQLAGQGGYLAPPVIRPGVPLFLGSNPKNHVPGAAATLRNFKVYGRALDEDEIAGLSAQPQ